MSLQEYAKNLCFILWNTIVFLCSFVHPLNAKEREIISFVGFMLISKYLNNAYKPLKEIINKKILKNKNNSIAAISASAKHIYKKPNSVLNRIYSNTRVTNKALKNASLFYIKILNDALATQNLISPLNQHIIPLGAMVIIYQTLLIQLDLSCIKAYSYDIRKVMIITQDKCAYFLNY